MLLYRLVWQRKPNIIAVAIEKNIGYIISGQDLAKTIRIEVIEIVSFSLNKDDVLFFIFDSFFNFKS